MKSALGCGRFTWVRALLGTNGQLKTDVRHSTMIGPADKLYTEAVATEQRVSQVTFMRVHKGDEH